MSRKTRFAKKLINLFWAFLSALPIILFMSYFIQWLGFNNVGSYVDVDNWLSSINDLCYDFYNDFSWHMSPFGNSLVNVFNILFNGCESLDILTANFIDWYIIIQLVHFTTDLLLWPLNAFKDITTSKLGDNE